MSTIAHIPLHLMNDKQLAEHWATEFVDRLTLTELEQVTKGNLALITQFPRLRKAREV